jgi:transcriptional regulator with XRE-family HTH domain
MRPSKNLHVIALLRKEMAPPTGLTQREFGERAGIPESTIQGIELKRRRLSRPIAEKISSAFDVSLDSLLLNDIAGGLKRRNGEPWTNKTRVETDKKFKRWGNLAPDARMAKLNATQLLLSQYLELSAFFEDSSLDGQTALNDWLFLYQLASRALKRLHERAEYRKADSRTIDSVVDDVRALKSNIAAWTTRAKKSAKSKNRELGIKRLLAERYGWDDRGLAAVELAEELGFERVSDMMYPDQFAGLLNERLKQKGQRLLFRESNFTLAFAAIKAVYGEFSHREGATSA